MKLIHPTLPGPERGQVQDSRSRTPGLGLQVQDFRLLQVQVQEQVQGERQEGETSHALVEDQQRPQARAEHDLVALRVHEAAPTPGVWGVKFNINFY